MELRIKTGDGSGNLAILNSYAPPINHDYAQVMGYWDTLDTHHAYRKKLSKFGAPEIMAKSYVLIIGNDI